MKLITIFAIFLTAWRILQMDVTAMIPHHRKWVRFSANLEKLFEEDITEVELFHARPLACLKMASSDDFANVACIKNSSCVYLYVSDVLSYEGPQTDDGYKCYIPPLCSHEGVLLRENENVTVADPACLSNRTLTCSMQGMIFDDVPPPRTTCTAPFEQLPFGCMYDSQEFLGTYCEARQYCQELGANLASPETEQDLTDMLDYYNTKHAGNGEVYYVGLYKVDGVWRWPANQREAAPPGEEDWGFFQSSANGDVAVMYNRSFFGWYAIDDAKKNLIAKALCHVWTTV